MKRKKPTTLRIVIEIDQTKISRGHFKHKSGAGRHQDKRKKGKKKWDLEDF